MCVYIHIIYIYIDIEREIDSVDGTKGSQGMAVASNDQCDRVLLSRLEALQSMRTF